MTRSISHIRYLLNFSMTRLDDFVNFQGFTSLMTSNPQKKNSQKVRPWATGELHVFVVHSQSLDPVGGRPSLPFCFLNIWGSVKSGEDPLKESQSST